MFLRRQKAESSTNHSHSTQRPFGPSESTRSPAWANAVPLQSKLTGASSLNQFPHQAEIEARLGMPINAEAVVNPSTYAEHGAPAFTEGNTVHFASGQPDLNVAAHEAAHVLQHSGRTNDAGLGAEGHAGAVAHHVANHQSAQGLIGSQGSPIASGVRPYTVISFFDQKPDNWMANVNLRVSDNGKMAVGLVGDMHDLWATSDVISHSNSILTNLGSVIRLEDKGDKLTGKAPSGGTKQTLTKVLPKNVANATTGENMNLWADCGKSARDVMGAGQGTGEHHKDMTAVYKAPDKAFGKAAGTVNKETAASSPDAMKKEIFNQKLGGKGDEGLKKYMALSPAQKEKFDKSAGINKYAAPATGEGYTTSTGGANYPGTKPWNFHWGGVVMTDGDDRVTLENYAVGDASVKNNDWIFMMYGSAKKAGQTFHEQHKSTELHGKEPTTMGVKKR